MNLIVHVNGMPVPNRKGNRHKHQTLLKYLLAMKLFIIILILSLNVSAKKAYSQKVDLSVRNAPLQDVMQKIREQTGYYFLFVSDILKDAKPVNATLKQVNIEDALNVIFKDQPFTWKIQDKGIVIKPRAVAKGDVIDKVKDNNINIKGKVVDENGKPLPGASVRASGKVTVTNSDGEFSLSGIDEIATIEISYIGYATKTVKASSNQFIVVQLEHKAGELEEVVVNKGYYSIKQELNTGSVGTLKAVDIAKQPVNDFAMALQGRIAGLSVSQISGVPGASLKINIRGLNSIANGNEPLYIIDGVPFPSLTMSKLQTATMNVPISPLNAIRPDNIESITVLKDADATAIYGSRGANGVILITTKQGKAGRTKADFNVYRGVSKVPRFIDLMNTEQFLAMRNEAFKNDNATPQDYDVDVNGVWGNQKRYTDWQKMLIGGTAETIDANATVSGGTELTQYLFSTGYRRETTVFPGNFPSNIGTANLSINHRSEDGKFRISLSTNYTYSNYRLPTFDATSLIYTVPNTPSIYDAKGNINWENGTFDNPFGALLQKAQSVTDNLVSNLSLSYQLLAGLELKLNAGYNTVKLDESRIIPATSYIPGTSDDLSVLRNYNRGTNQIRTWNLEPQLDYNRKFGKHQLEALIATTLQSTNQAGIFIDARGYPSDALIENPAFATTKSNNTTFSDYRYAALFSRIGYNYDGKYVLNLTGRRDGSSRFGPSNRYGNFGAIGAAWVFSKERFIKDNLSFLSLGKIRGSIGRTGNDQLQNYQYLSTYVSDGTAYAGNNGLFSNRLTNPYYGWETINKAELGIELGFFKDRLQFNADLFRNKTKNQLVGYALPPSTGFPNITANLPAVIQNKGLEIEIRSVNLETKNFTWNSSFNLTVPQNKLISFPNLAGTPYATQYIIGQPLGVSFLYQYTGIDRTTGLYTFEDVNKDGGMTFPEDTKPVFVGQKLYGGFSNTFSYKGFSLDVFLQFVKQNGRKYIGPSTPGSYGSNQPVLVLDRWTKSGDQTTYQRFNQDGAADDAYNKFVSSNAIIVDASFIRLKNLMAAYTLPLDWTRHLSMQRIRLYIQAQNLFTFTKYKSVDPELASGAGLPPLRTMTTGIQFTF